MNRKTTIKMKRYILPLFLVILFTGAMINATTKETELIPVTTDDMVDPDFLKNELRGAVLEFAEDAGLDPDSIYMPFE